MKLHIRRGASRLLRIIRRRSQSPAVQVCTPQPGQTASHTHEQHITTADEELMRERVRVALRDCATEVTTARQLADEVPEATPALRAIMLAAAHRRVRNL